VGEILTNTCPKCNAILSFVADRNLVQAVIDGECFKTCDVCGYKTWIYRGGKVWCLICGEEIFEDKEHKQFKCKCGWIFNLNIKSFKPIQKPAVYTRKPRKKKQQNLDKY
jgi:hypothetical protein